MLIDLSDRVVCYGCCKEYRRCRCQTIGRLWGKVVIADIDSVNGKSVAESIINQEEMHTFTR